MLKKKIWANFQRIVEVFTQKFSICSQIYGFGIRDPEKTYSGSRIQGSKRHRIPDPQHCLRYTDFMPHRQRWAKGPIDRSSDTDSIFRLYLLIQSVDVKFRFLYRATVSVHFKFRFFHRPILFLGFKFRFLYMRLCWSVLSSDSFRNQSCFLVLSSNFCTMRLCRPVLSKKSLYRYFIC
jgi:hypothetical protein